MRMSPLSLVCVRLMVAFVPSAAVASHVKLFPFSAFTSPGQSMELTCDPVCCSILVLIALSALSVLRVAVPQPASAADPVNKNAAMRAEFNFGIQLTHFHPA